MSQPIITVLQGELKGSVRTTPDGFKFHTFLGIPYTKPPIGNLRFQDPQPPEEWTGTRDATVQGAINPQIDLSEKHFMGEEDSLFLNVSVPSTASPESNLPVMCYIHGGGFYAGDGTFEKFRPDFLVQKNVIFVSFNYRLGILGFLCLHTNEVPGNAGLKDQVFALRWIQKNIKFFGGDPQNVTIVGESAGGACVHYHVMSPMSKGLFKRAIIQSGTCLCEWAKQKDPLMHAFQIAEKLGMEKTSSKDKLLKFLRNVPTRDLVIGSGIEFNYWMDIWFCGVVERQFPNRESFLIESPEELMKTGNYNIVPCIIGTTSHEGLLFLSSDVFEKAEKGNFELSSDDVKVLIKRHTMRDITTNDSKAIHNFYFKNMNPVLGLSDFVSDIDFVIHTANTAKLLRMHNDNVFYYLYAFRGNLNRMLPTPLYPYDGATHTDDDAYLYKNESDEIQLSSQDLSNRERMVRMWTNFAKFGNPTPQKDDVITELWKPITKEEFRCFEIRNDLKMIVNPFFERLSFMNSILSKYHKL